MVSRWIYIAPALILVRGAVMGSRRSMHTHKRAVYIFAKPRIRCSAIFEVSSCTAIFFLPQSQNSQRSLLSRARLYIKGPIRPAFASTVCKNVWIIDPYAASSRQPLLSYFIGRTIVIRIISFHTRDIVYFLFSVFLFSAASPGSSGHALSLRKQDICNCQKFFLLQRFFRTDCVVKIVAHVSNRN